jgi:HSP20 family protein
MRFRKLPIPAPNAWDNTAAPNTERRFNVETQRTNQGQSTLSQGKSETSPPAEREQRITRTSGNFTPSLWGGHPFDTMMRLSRDMDRLMDSFFGRERNVSRAAPELWQPRIDMRQQGDKLLISAELPGIPRDAVKIECSDEGIAISGERRESREEGGRDQGYQLSERSYGSFYRVIPLPDGAKGEDAKATMRDGVLEISVPYKQTTQRRQIQITE